MNVDSSLASCKKNQKPTIYKSFDLHECKRKGQKCGANLPVKNNAWQMKISSVFITTPQS